MLEFTSADHACMADRCAGLWSAACSADDAWGSESVCRQQFGISDVQPRQSGRVDRRCCMACGSPSHLKALHPASSRAALETLVFRAGEEPAYVEKQTCSLSHGVLDRIGSHLVCLGSPLRTRTRQPWRTIYMERSRDLLGTTELRSLTLESRFLGHGRPLRLSELRGGRRRDKISSITTADVVCRHQLRVSADQFSLFNANLIYRFQHAPGVLSPIRCRPYVHVGDGMPVIRHDPAKANSCPLPSRTST